MPKRTNPFQHLFHHIYRQLGKDAVVSESNEILDRVTGTLREVDILVETQIAGHKQVLGIECTSAAETIRRRPADVGWVEQMIAKHRDLPTDHLVLVSETGFSKPAIKKAQFYRAETIALGVALDESWTKIVGKLNKLRHEEINHVYKCSFVVRDADGKAQYQPADLSQIVLGSDGSSSTVGSLAQSIFAQPEVRDAFFGRMNADGTEPFWCNYTLPEGVRAFYVDASGARKEWERLVVNIASTRSSAVIPLRHGSLGNKKVAYGEGTGSSSKIMISVIEEKGKIGTLMVTLSTGRHICKVSPQQESNLALAEGNVLPGNKARHK